MSTSPLAALGRLVPRAPDYLIDRDRLRSFVDALGALPAGPHVASFHPTRDYPGAALVIAGAGFDPDRAANQARVGGRPAYVLEADPNRLLVLTHPEAKTGPVEVTVGGAAAAGATDFVALPWPHPDSGLDGPPYAFEGRKAAGGPVAAGSAAAGDIPPTGTARVLVVPCFPTDSAPADPAAVRAAIVATFGNVTTYYDQVSYGTLDVQVDVTDFVALIGDADYYHRPNGAAGYPNIDQAVLAQLMAEAAQGAVDAGRNLDDFRVMAVLVHLPGLAVRAWGGWSQSSFAFSGTDAAGNPVNINLVAANPLALIAARHDADWGRAAHEFGHNLVDGGMALGEDVYASDLVDPAEATAQAFEMMGSHDSHPLFSGFYMHQLGYYGAANVADLTWDRNPFSQEFVLVAHGLARNADAARKHLLRIKVGDGIHYFVEVRQRPPAGSSQVFDTNIPVPGGSGRDGGVIVTKCVSGPLNNNHQTRLITLLQDDATVMLLGETSTDPLRTLVITVLNDQVSADPLACRVRVEWAQVIGNTPGGDFDLRIEPWNANWESPDVYVDRQPFGAFDFTDPSGNPTGNGDAPRPMEVNRFHAVVHNDGAAAAANVRVTFYAVNPPGVGDNGNWAPLGTRVVANVAANGQTDQFVNWVPLVGEHTCLKVVAEPQLGEVSVGNNSAQENVFVFQPAASVPGPVVLPVAVRNPLNRRVCVQVHLDNVPVGYRAYFPHQWLYLDALSERQLALAVVPLYHLQELRVRDANVRLSASIHWGYLKSIATTGVPGSWFAPIGGLTARVMPKPHGKIELRPDQEVPRGQVGVVGQVTPAATGQPVRVDATSPAGEVRSVVVKTDASGRFRAAFDLTVKGVYEAQAHIFNAPEVAPASSNVVYIKR